MKTTITFLKKNKALLILPLALLPFVVLIFYILGGGEHAISGKANSSRAKLGQSGANYQLPGADRSIQIHDKMEAYQQERSQFVSTHDYNIMGEDSTDKELKQNGQFADSTGIPEGQDREGLNVDVSNNLLAHIKEKEQQVRKELEGSSPNEKLSAKGRNRNRVRNKPIVSSKATKYKEHREKQPVFSKTGIEELDKVFDENTALVKQNDSLNYSLKQANQKLNELEAKKKSSLHVEKKEAKGFGKGITSNSPIKAEVYETVTVLDGNRVKLRLLEACKVNGKQISGNTFIYGTCRVKNERLDIHVAQLPVGDGFLPVDLSIHDLDGLEGLYVPDNAARKVAKDVGGSTNTSSLFGVTANPLAYAGVRAADKTAQSLLKMVRLKKVTIKKNTLVYLINKE